MISPTPNVKNFDLNDDIFLDELENSLSVDRFRTYLTATDGDRVQAVRCKILAHLSKKSWALEQESYDT